jgi:hypothetical protein
VEITPTNVEKFPSNENLPWGMSFQKEKGGHKLGWWHTSKIPVLRRLRQENHEFKTSLGYTAAPCLTTTITTAEDIAQTGCQ